MKRIVITCDLCGGEDMGCYIVIKAKQQWWSWYETGFSRRKIYICEDCQKSLCEAAKADRKHREEDNL
jgi:hypothetical protein